jgi:hypothetical protein
VSWINKKQCHMPWPFCVRTKKSSLKYLMLLLNTLHWFQVKCFFIQIQWSWGLRKYIECWNFILALANNVLFGGVLCKWTFIFPTLLLFNFLICTYLNLLKFHYKFLFTSKFDTLCLFKFLISIFEVVTNYEDVTEHDKIMWSC